MDFRNRRSRHSIMIVNLRRSASDVAWSTKSRNIWRACKNCASQDARTALQRSKVCRLGSIISSSRCVSTAACISLDSTTHGQIIRIRTQSKSFPNTVWFSPKRTTKLGFTGATPELGRTRENTSVYENAATVFGEEPNHASD